MMPTNDYQIILNQALTTLRNNPSSLSVETVTLIANQAVDFFFAYSQTHKKVLREAVEVICSICLLPDPSHAGIGVEALFPQLIERLNDAFDADYCRLYDQVFAQVITFCRHTVEGSELDEALTKFGVYTEADLLVRKTQLTRPKKLSVSRSFKKIFLLSRITIGADIAVTSVILSRMKQVYPSAELVFIGSAKLRELYGGDPSIRIKEIKYAKTDSLIARLNVWLNLLALLQAEVMDLDSSDFCIIDPDSRLTQLGLFPLLPAKVEAQSYFYFPSRIYTKPDFSKLGELANAWLNDLFDAHITDFPFLSLPLSQSHLGESLVRQFRATDCQPIFCLNFGYGGNQSKRVSETFEIRFSKLLAGKYKFFLDFGFTPDEKVQSERIIESIAALGKAILYLNESNFHSLTPSAISQADVIAWQGGIGSFAALISACDFYLGYDSSGQHIAAAVGTPSLTLFLNSGGSKVFCDRWHPYGRGLNQIIVLQPDNPYTENQILELVTDALPTSL